MPPVATTSPTSTMRVVTVPPRRRHNRQIIEHAARLRQRGRPPGRAAVRARRLPLLSTGFALALIPPGPVPAGLIVSGLRDSNLGHGNFPPRISLIHLLLRHGLLGKQGTDALGVAAGFIFDGGPSG